MVVLVRVAAEGRGLIYTSASFSGQSDFVSQKSCICAVTHITKSACPTAAEKCLPTAICPYSRWRRQPLSSASRKQRYNTLDFLVKVVCHETSGFFGFFQSMGNTIPSEHPRQRETLFPFEIPLPTGMLLAPIGNSTPKELPLWNTLMSMHRL